MNYEQTYNVFGNIDIYVIDQILKNRYHPGQSIFDAGCGGGRNLKWFYLNDFELTGMDADTQRIAEAKHHYPKASANFKVGKLENLLYQTNSFDHILCCAVLHFAENETHFMAMFSELLRVLKPQGTLLIRVASNIGLEDEKPVVQDGKSGRSGNFFITRALISELLETHPLKLIEPVKTTNVQDIRAMTTLVFQKH